MKVRVKPNSVMGDYICLHWLVPNNELPKRFRNKIPKNEIWIRKDIWDNPLRRNATLLHEEAELERMVNGHLTYKQAHSWAEVVDGFM